MMNFRYHLVSLIAVFVALSIGVILGAGPLQSRISGALADKNATSSVADSQALAQAQALASAEAAGLDAIASNKLDGTLSGMKVTTIGLPGATAEDITTVSDRLSAAGAEVIGHVSLTDNFDNAGLSQYRETLSSPLSSHMSNLPSSASGEAIISFGIVSVLTTTGSETDLVKEILTDDSTPIMSIATDPAGATEAIVVVGPRASTTALVQNSADASQSGVVERAPQAWMGLAQAVTSVPKSAVIVADASTDSSMGQVLRTQGAQVTSIDSPGTTLSAISAVISLKDASATARAYGVQNGATAVMPELP